MKPHLLILPVALVVGCGNLDDYIDAECARAGDLGCECAPLDTCNRGPDGLRLACIDGICQPAACVPERPGEAGCACEGSKPCAEGHVCAAGRCEVDTGQTLQAPAEPKCFTPCRGDLNRRDGTSARCGSDGLLPGCIDGAICRAGTCIVPRASLLKMASSSFGRACKMDSDCPDFQACIEGACYSDCEEDRQCRGGRKCHRNTCRIPCTTTSSSCPAETVCSTVDGEAGFCMPVTPTSGASIPLSADGFELSLSTLTFSTQSQEGAFEILNRASSEEVFVIRKVRHREFSDRGPSLQTNQPLHWLSLSSAETDPERVTELSVTIPAGESKSIAVSGVDNETLDRWDGVLEVVNSTMGTQSVFLSYARSPEGQWTGSMYYIANFPDAGLASWTEDRSNRAALSAVGNAFIRRWGALRNNKISLDEFRAAVTAMQTESWKWDSVRERCPHGSIPDPNVGCYLYDNNVGIAVFSDFLPNAPIPTGVVGLPITMNLRSAGANPRVWQGKIVSSETLHYAGDPKVDLSFAVDPNFCSTSVGNTCLTILDSFTSNILVGGRYATTATDNSCSRAAQGTFSLVREPWLIAGFDGESTLDANGRRYRYECRDELLPFDTGNMAHNISMAASNPIPDGATRRRTIELVDGALIDQQTLFVIFREHLPSFLDPHDAEGFSSYGYMELTRTRAHLTSDDYEGFSPVDVRVPPQIPGVSCTDALVDRLLGPGADLDPDILAIGVVDGVIDDPDSPAPTITPESDERVHYLCVDTGLFNGGPGDNGTSGAVKVPCPRGSRVEYFTLKGTASTATSIAGLACQQGNGVCRAGEPCEFVVRSPADCVPDEPCVSGGCTPGERCSTKGSCEETLAQWKTNGTHSIRTNLVWKCDDPNQISCDANRSDLREGKTFFAESAAQAVFRSLDDEIMEAFRYKTRFRTRAGRSVGFAPQVCVGDAFPYCYDPDAIEGIRDRVDCATHLYTDYYSTLSASARSKLKEYLVRNFSYAEEMVHGLAAPVIHDGFERLYAELLIMMGDESFTAAFSSRFDLAGQKLANFEGDLFEPQGLQLSGGAGFEMFSLYQAAQYYQLTLDRFYKQASVIWKSLDGLPAGQGFITQATTVSYFDRLIRASSQKARVWSEIAKRYEAFNRPDLARLVIERAYVQATLESTVLSQMMRKVSTNADATAEAQITRAVELAQYTYRAALLDMRNVYSDISDAVTFHGIPPDYVPFPALDPLDTNAFSKVMTRAREISRVAADKEVRALSESRSFDTDSALFQAELGRIRDESEGRLGDICGTFAVGDSGDPAIYPAIPKYAYLSDMTRLLGDPCGLVGNGELYEAIIELEMARLDLEGIKLAQRNLMLSALDTEDRARQQCTRIESLADFVFETAEDILSYQEGIRSLQLVIDTTSDLLDGFSNILQIAGCETFGCMKSTFTSMMYTGWFIAGQITKTVSRGIIIGLETSIADLENAQVRREIMEECEAIKIDVVFEVKDLLRRSLELQLEATKLQYGVQLASSRIRKLRNEATATMASQAENEEMAINIEAARNDPNIRIYRNDAVNAADRTFHMTLREAYRATRVFEYYTSQSYAALDKLFLVRMVANGDVTLEAYLDELEREFLDFQEQYGNPDTRVAIVSLRDDILRIPRIDESGIALSEMQRTMLLRERLEDASLLDARGYLVMPFSTSHEELSPLTRNHKVRFIEAEIVGDNVGDTLGRLYLTQRGTGVVRSVDRRNLYYAFPVRTAVINPFFNGTRPLAAEVYRSERLRDRPYINTGWDLVFNQKDEEVNADIVLGSLIDMRLFVYYTDFTEL